MSVLWIVHREARDLAALARLAASEDAVRGAPGDPRFETAPPAAVVLLGLGSLGEPSSDAWEAELEFAHRHRARLADARWILVGARTDADMALDLFDRVVAEFLPWPPPGDALRQRLQAAGRAQPEPLSQRARRAALAARFSRWLADLEIPALLRAMDPRLAEVPVQVRGEPGTGRATLVRYVHEFGVTGAGALAHVPCVPERSGDEIRARLLEASRERGPVPCLGVWLDEANRLAPDVQRQLCDWIELGPPAGVRAARLRWLASVDETGPALEPALAHALGGLVIRLPPLRERPGRAEAVATETARLWAAVRREPVRRFTDEALAALAEYPWPGNLRELESVIEQTLATGGADPIGADDLALEGLASAPVDATELGTLLDEDADEEEARAAEGRESAADGAGPPIVAGGGPEPAAPRSPAEPDREPPEASVPPPAPAAEPPIPIPVREPVREAERVDAPAAADEGTLGRLAGALSHEVRNPLATIRTFAGLLPERFDDPEFRARFTEMVNDDVARIDGLLGRLEQLVDLDAPRTEKVDVPALLESLLDERRERFRERHLLVLKELDASRPLAEADPRQLRVAFEALLDTALECVPERGDVYLASRHHDGGASGAPSVRVLLRFHDPRALAPEPGLPVRDRSLAMLVAELLVRAQGGRLTQAASEAEERVVVIDLPAP